MLMKINKKSEIIFSIKQPRSSVKDIILERIDKFIIARLKKLSKFYISTGEANLCAPAFDIITHEVLVFGRYETKALTILTRWFNSLPSCFLNGIAIDVGANIGNHSIWLAKNFLSVIALEPVKKTFELLKLNTESFKNISINNTAASSNFGESHITINDLHNMGGAHISSQTEDSEPIRLTPLDSLELEAPLSLIKIDAESHEYDVLLGARELMKKYLPVIIFEQHKSEINDGTSASIELLRSQGYDFFLTFQNNFNKNKGFNLICKILGACHLSLVETKYFEKKNYQLIVAGKKQKHFL